MAASAGYKAFEKVFTTAHIKVYKGLGRTVEKALDPATLTMIFGFLTSALKICFNRDGEQATIQRLKSRGGLNATETYRALRRGGYAADERPKQQRELCRQMAAELTAQTGKVSAEDLEAFLDDARETPTPSVPVDDGDGSFWGILLAFCFLFIGSTAMAADDGSFWNAEADIKATRAAVTTLGEDVVSLKQRMTVLEQETRSNTTTLNRIADKLLPPEQGAVCQPEDVTAPIALAEPTEAERLAILSEKLVKLQAELTLLGANPPVLTAVNGVRIGAAQSAGTSVSLPAGTRRARIRFRNRDIYDVDAFLAANPCNEVGMARGYEGQIDMHLRQHGYTGDFSGMSYAKKIRLHSVAHKGSVRWPSESAAAVTVSATRLSPNVSMTMQSNCANGSCARSYGTSTTVTAKSRRGGGILSVIFGRRG